MYKAFSYKVIKYKIMLLRTYTYLTIHFFVVGSSSAVESPIKIVKAKPKMYTPPTRKSLDFNSQTSNIVAGIPYKYNINNLLFIKSLKISEYIIY